MNTEQADLPAVSRFWQDGFHRFLPRMLRNSFHTMAITRDSRSALDLPPSQPLIVYANHVGWWDPLVAHYMCRRVLQGRQFYAPIDADALEQYRVFRKLGFYGVRADTQAGIRSFLKTSRTILETPGTSLWITPTGRFSDVRDRSVPFAPGLAHLCAHLVRGTVVPMAIEYSFWEERLPECLMRFGEPLEIQVGQEKSSGQWNEQLMHQLHTTQQHLAERVIARDPAAFEVCLQGGAGAGGVYDFFRRVRSWCGGRRFVRQHGEKFS
ncbi:lysophospholipid acyltransferase family protein [Roseimaritima sediminicola]|uniref:lysophospholipid acyltransferase family protein n=1 Tax=Roseimaritima sediminicola TaxID=2662066 RepID=UPI001F4834D3|nr:lysophospholipid acyltransferase family protein [Roseimaritima sediminicola]